MYKYIYIEFVLFITGHDNPQKRWRCDSQTASLVWIPRDLHQQKSALTCLNFAKTGESSKTWYIIHRKHLMYHIYIYTCIYIYIHDIRVYLLYIHGIIPEKQNPLTGPPRSRLVAHLSIKPQGLNLRSSAAGRSDFHWFTWKKNRSAWDENVFFSVNQWWNCHKHISDH